ncbi:MAG TPA: acyltransferase [Dokdonella sp.]
MTPANERPTGGWGAVDGGRLRCVDALRGIAALLVVWMHVSESFASLGPIDGKWIHELARSVDVGRIGVVAFFLVSGFVIPFSIRADQAAPVGSFVIKRFFRIAPAYWLSIPLGALTGWWIWGREFGARDLLLNFMLLHDVFGARPAEGLYWTLVVEVVFYACCVVLLLARSLDRMWRIWGIAALFTAVYSFAMLLRWAGLPALDSNTAFCFLNLSMMFCGTLYRHVVFDRGARGDGWLRIGVAALFAYHLVVLPVAAVAAIGFERNATIPYALGSLLFIVGTRIVPLAHRATDWLGRVSYSIYLFHPIVFMSLLWWLLRQPADSWWRSGHLGAYLLVNVVLTLLVAGLVHRWVEQPGIALGRRMARWWQRRTVPDAPTTPPLAHAAPVRD